MIITGQRTDHKQDMKQRDVVHSQQQKECAILMGAVEVDMLDWSAFHKAKAVLFKRKFGVELTPISAFCRAVTYALSEQPVLNAHLEGSDVVYRHYIDLSVSIQTSKGKS